MLQLYVETRKFEGQATHMYAMHTTYYQGLSVCIWSYIFMYKVFFLLFININLIMFTTLNFLLQLVASYNANLTSIIQNFLKRV